MTLTDPKLIILINKTLYIVTFAFYTIYGTGKRINSMLELS